MSTSSKERKPSIVRRIKNYLKLVVKNILLSKRFHLMFKVSAVAVVLILTFYGAYLYINKSVGGKVVVSKSEIIARVGKLTEIPKGEPDALVRVEDPEILKKQNVFYENVKRGDYILIYPSVAIIYDLLNNTVVSVKKVEVE